MIFRKGELFFKPRLAFLEHKLELHNEYVKFTV